MEFKEELFKNIHFIPYKNNFIAYFYNMNELLHVNQFSKNILTELFIKRKRISQISLENNIKEKDIIKFQENIIQFIENTFPNPENSEKQSTGRIPIEYKINISHKCNFKCKYCYADYKSENIIMSISTARSIAKSIQNQFENSDILITFFGGEPLLNVPAMKEFCDILSENNDEYDNKYFFAIITNGSILNEEIIEIFKKYKFSVKVSIDGPKKINDKLRVYSNGNGTFDVINKNIIKLKKELTFGRLTYEATYTNIGTTPF